MMIIIYEQERSTDITKFVPVAMALSALAAATAMGLAIAGILSGYAASRVQLIVRSCYPELPSSEQQSRLWCLGLCFPRRAAVPASATAFRRVLTSKKVNPLHP
jgi:hypothetical protein